MLALLLLASLWCLSWSCGDFGQVEQQWCSSCSCVLAIWWLTKLLVDGLLVLAVEKVLYAPCFALLVDNKAWPPSVTHWPVCVWCAACTVPCELLDCVCVPVLGIWLGPWLWDDQLGRADPYLLKFYFLLTCQVAMPLGIILGFVVFVCREQSDDPMIMKIIKYKTKWSLVCSVRVGSGIVISFSFLFSIYVQFL
jgi:hypothetical protein